MKPLLLAMNFSKNSSKSDLLLMFLADLGPISNKSSTALYLKIGVLSLNTELWISLFLIVEAWQF